ncbi:hypothetical protein GE061_006345 [Apolygus lucorum]|uniref:Peptidase S1 domain-containing protein n=1 Tax=Apolygus lucorum TaxID=248454 RepID=A0A8S9WXK9_APOLU|nr:hypothetical protein GE061_006345 [Apolygus lucorum]
MSKLGRDKKPFRRSVCTAGYNRFFFHDYSSVPQEMGVYWTANMLTALSVFQMVIGDLNEDISHNSSTSSINNTINLSTRLISVPMDCACVQFYQCVNGTFDKHGINQIIYKSDFTSNEYIRSNLLPNSCPGYQVWCCSESHKSTGRFPSEPEIGHQPPEAEEVGSNPEITFGRVQEVSNKTRDASGCGYSEKPTKSGIQYKIIGRNNEALAKEFPWSVMILTQDRINPKLVRYECGGSLIHKRVVLTVAHCAAKFGQQRAVVRAGEYNTKLQEKYQERFITKIITHPAYDDDTLHNDMALLVTDKDFQLAPNVNILCLPMEEDRIVVNDCIVAGWGNNKDDNNHHVLKKTTLSTVLRDECQSKLRETEELGADFELHESFVCAGGIEGKDACKGDGGSPLICPIKGKINRYHQVGIVAWGIKCGEALPGVYVNVARFKVWIDGEMKKLGFTTDNKTPVKPSQSNYETESDSEDSEEYQHARGYSQTECGCGKSHSSKPKWEGPTNDEPENKNVHTTSQVNQTNLYKGSTWAVTNSNAESHSEVQPESNVEDRFSFQFSLVKGCSFYIQGGRHVQRCNYRTSNEPLDDVTGNGRPQTEKTRIVTTTPPPVLDDRVTSNSFFFGRERFKGKETPKDSQDGVQEPQPLLATSPKCGISLRNRIVGGMPSTVDNWPWMVAYGFRDRKTEQEFVWMCGGSLVTEKHTITVAHCLMSDTHYMDVARIGDIYLNSTLDENSIAEQRKVNRNFIVHPDYNHTSQNKMHDIAIVTVKEPFSKRYTPICLPFQLDMRNNQFTGKDAFVAGWGATSFDSFSSDVLLDVKLPIVDNEICRKFYMSRRVNIDSSHICAGAEAGKDSCRGDSGGPLMIKNDKNKAFYLIGVVSFGASCGQPGAPGVYTRITSHLSWLEEHLKDK